MSSLISLLFRLAIHVHWVFLKTKHYDSKSGVRLALASRCVKCSCGDHLAWDPTAAMTIPGGFDGEEGGERTADPVPYETPEPLLSLLHPQLNLLYPTIIGAGTFGLVVKAMDARLNPPEDVAIKMLPRGQRVRIRTGSFGLHDLLVAVTPTYLCAVSAGEALQDIH